MLISANGLNWQTVQPQNRPGSDPPQTPIATFQPVTASSKPGAQQNSQGSTSQQSAEDNRKEAFAKLMIMLQNPDASSRQQTSVGKQEGSAALQEFRDYMAKSPAEKIKEKLLQELGLTEDEYNALPPEKKMRVDELIAQRMQEDVRMKTQARLEQQAQHGQPIGRATMPGNEKPKTAEL
ncbi:MULTISPECIES: hypothetical protein [unclassified Pseudomonas]|uniref:hypothetical protein n=1 Tax=unclassified Pseudomonas TaxID=196821 RepID=UPI00244B8DAE|nr:MULTISPECIES: hypothetical protein [unclassified Pseudomonas]MDH0300343.1 hypothetical protein [Pseudomonas sp. GD04091]MDH1986085.1 hypothetical protein [Pseudomonas sp. GD03689]